MTTPQLLAKSLGKPLGARTAEHRDVGYTFFAAFWAMFFAYKRKRLARQRSASAQKPTPLHKNPDAS